MIREDEQRRMSIHQLQLHRLFRGRPGETSVKAHGDVGSVTLVARRLARQQEHDGRDSLGDEELEVCEEDE